MAFNLMDLIHNRPEPIQDAEITMLEGGQPVYHYLISVE